MADTDIKPRDDAPATTSKDDAIRNQATEALIDAEGASVSGRTVNINRPRHELFAYFRDFTNLATFMENIERIDVVDAKRSHWVVKAPAGRRVEWDAIVTDETDGEHIAWTSAEDADVLNSGRVEFRDATGGRGTTVTATIAYEPPAGALGKLVASIFQREPELQARRDLRRFKQLMETGEIAVAARTRADARTEKGE